MNRKINILFGLMLIIAFLVPTAVSAMKVDTVTARVKPAPVSITILEPTAGDTVSDVVTITVDTSTAPEILIDDVEVAIAYSYDWDTTTVADGEHTITAKVKRVSVSITVTVANGGDPDPDPEPEPTGDKHALIIGISDYEGTSSDLTYCDDDALDWKEYFQGLGYSITMLLDQQATANNIIGAMEDLAAAEQAGDIVAVTYSGHGYYDRGSKQSGWVSHDLYLVGSELMESITDTFDSTAVFWFNDCCNIGTYADLANVGWVVGMGSNTRTYTYDGTSEMQNGIYTYFAMEAIELGYTTAEDICNYAADAFNAVTPGKASTIDNYSGSLVL